MLSSLNVYGYRKFKSQEFSDLSRINLFVGKNNVGKTTVLECVYGWASGQNLSPFFWAGIQRNQLFSKPNAYHIAENIFSAMYIRDTVPFSFQLVAVDNDEEVSFRHTIHVGDVFKDFVRNVAMTSSASNDGVIYLQNNNHSNMIEESYVNGTMLAKWEITKNDESTQIYHLEHPNLFLSNIGSQRLASFKDISSYKNTNENRIIYSYLKRQNMLERLVDEMNVVFPEVETFDMLPYSDNSLGPVGVKLKNGDTFPIDVFGEGFRRFYQIVGSMIFYHDSILCLDEVDATFHPEAQQNLAQNLIRYARRYNVQLFMTTHNLEFIDKFLCAWKSDKALCEIDDIRIITMKETDKKIVSRNMTGNKALTAREDYKMELR